MKLVCRFCNKVFYRPCGLVNHERYCLYNSNNIQEFYCKYCNKYCKNDNSLRNHERMCKLNPQRQSSPFTVASNRFNTAINKRSVESINKAKATYAKNKELGLYRSYGHKHSEETKQKLRTLALNNGLGGTTYKTIYNYNGINLDSSYELKVAQSLDRYKISWTRPGRFKWHDLEGKLHYYTPDFYLPDYNIYLDPKNDYLIKQDTFKINQVMKENNIKVIILDKNHLTWDAIAALMFNG